MPGGRPRKYADKDATKAANRLKAVERKAAKKAAKDSSGASGVGDASTSDDSYRFILEDTVRLYILILLYLTNINRANRQLLISLRIHLQADPQAL